MTTRLCIPTEQAMLEARSGNILCGARLTIIDLALYIIFSRDARCKWQIIENNI